MTIEADKKGMIKKVSVVSSSRSILAVFIALPDGFPPVRFQLLRFAHSFRLGCESKHELRPSLEPADHWQHRAKLLWDAPRYSRPSSMSNPAGPTSPP